VAYDIDRLGWFQFGLDALLGDQPGLDVLIH
jgi:hypothetical protein